MNLSLIQTWEQCRLTAYLDPAGIPTIGWGTISYGPGKPVRLGDTITQAEADHHLESEALGIAGKLAQLVSIDLIPAQTEALVSFIYNVGMTDFRSSTLRRVINQHGAPGEITAQWLRWDKAHIDGQLVRVKGLRNRRRAEVAHYYQDDV